MPRSIVRNFTGGEVTPEMFGRFDLAKQQTGLALCYNYIVQPHGVVKNRTGMEYVLETKYSNLQSRLIEFSFNNEQTYVLEFGHAYIRVHTGGTTLTHTPLAITGVTNATQVRIDMPGHTLANGDWVFLDGIVTDLPDGISPLNGRWVKAANVVAGASFRAQDLRGNYIDSSDPLAYGVYVAGGTGGKILEIATPYLSTEVIDINFTQSNDVLTLVHQNHPPAELRRAGPTTWTLSYISFLPSIATPTDPWFVTAVGGANPPITHYYLCTAVAEGTLEESLPSNTISYLIDLTTSPSYLDIGVPATPGAIRMNVYKMKNGIFAFMAQTAPGGVVRDNNVAPDADKTAPFLTNPFPSANNYPGAVSYFEGRRVFAGTRNKPQTYWLTASGTENNMNYSIPTQDDDAITGRLAGRECNAIYHIVPLEQLILLTTGGEWKFAQSTGTVLTPANSFPRQQTTEGCTRVKPLLVNGSVIFVHEAGSRLRRMEFKWQANGWNTDDPTVLAPHIFEKKFILDAAHQKAPQRVLWFVLDNGQLAGVTYHPEHEVTAWHRHGTAGLFESVACVKEGSEYPLYAVVNRTIDGNQVRYIERMHSREVEPIEDAFFVDSGISYDGDPTNSIGGLWHLIGETVTVLGDGAVHAPCVVGVDGRITFELGVEFSKVHAGLGYVSRLQTVPPALENLEAFGTSSRKDMGPMYLRVDRSSTIKAGPSFERMREYPARSTEPYGEPPDLLTGVIEIPTDGHWSITGQMCVEQDLPLPSTVLGIVIEAASEGSS